MWIKINGTPVQAMDIEEVVVVNWDGIKRLLDFDIHGKEEMKYRIENPNYLNSFFVVVLMKPKSTGVNSWLRMKYFSKPFSTRLEAEQVRDELLTKLNAIEVQIENFSINPRLKNNDIRN